MNETAALGTADPRDWWKIKLDAANTRSGIGLGTYLAERAQKLS